MCKPGCKCKKHKESVMVEINGVPQILKVGVPHVVTTPPQEEVRTAQLIPVGVSQFTIKEDAINHPKHYTSHPSGVEAITVCEHMGFNIGNAMKYLWRCDLKNGVEDLRKAIWYIQREIDRREKGKV